MLDVIKIASVVGARPQFIKLAPIVRAIKKHNDLLCKPRINHFIIDTGQHYDYLMSKVFYDELEIPVPAYHLEVGSGTHGNQTGKMLERVEAALLRELPDLVLVYGDTNSTLAGALAASKLHLTVAHIEAGLRSYNKRMPEEINRVLTDHISDLLFCPTEISVRNLNKEGLAEGVFWVGDVMYDSVLFNVKIAERRSKILENLQLIPKNYVLATVHRAENTDNPERLKSIFIAFEEIGLKGKSLIIPLHPRTQKELEKLGISVTNVRLIEPVSYFDMLMLEKNAQFILTDSGGVQKEAFFFKVPCLTLRDETEWIETVDTGWNKLVGCERDRIVKACNEISEGIFSINPYGEGETGKHILSIISSKYKA